MKKRKKKRKNTNARTIKRERRRNEGKKRGRKKREEEKKKKKRHSIAGLYTDGPDAGAASVTVEIKLRSRAGESRVGGVMQLWV